MERNDSELVPAAARTLQILETFRTEKRPLTVSELARVAQIPVSSCHGLIRTLERLGYVYFIGAKEAYPTRKLSDVARDIDRHDPVSTRLAPALTALRDATQETVILGARQGDAVIYLLVVDSPEIVRYTANAGEYKPLHSSSIGKCLLAELSPDALDAWLATHELTQMAPNTIVDASTLKADLSAGKARGYFITRGENVKDVVAVAAALRLGGAVFSVAVAGPIHRMSESLEAHAAKLLKTIQAIEEESSVR